jgi:hypothetical protein
VDRGVEGEEVREEAWCTGADERKGRKEGQVAANAFYGGSVVRAERKGAQGSGVGATWRAGGGSGHSEDNSGGQNRPPASGRGRRRCRATGEGDGARATLARAAERRDWTTTGPGGQQLGAGGVRGSRAVRRGC